MEPLNSVAAVSPAGDAVEVWAGTQSQTITVAAVAQALGIPEDRVKFNDMLLGGGFGRRGNRDVEFIVDSVLMSKAAGRPVKVIWTREDDVHNGRFRPLYVNRIRAGLDASGRIVAWHHRVVCDEVLAFMDPVRYKSAKGRDNIAMRGTELPTYAIPRSPVPKACSRQRGCAPIRCARSASDRTASRTKFSSTSSPRSRASTPSNSGCACSMPRRSRSARAT